MPNFVDTTVQDIDRRLRELNDELRRLEAARAALTGTTRGPGRPRGSRRSSVARRGRPRARRGATRANQALDLVKRNPGITVPEIARRMGIKPNYLYRVMPELVAEGKVKRDGKSWHPV